MCIEFNWNCVSVLGEVSVGCVRCAWEVECECGVKCGCASWMAFRCDMWIM